MVMRFAHPSYAGDPAPQTSGVAGRSPRAVRAGGGQLRTSLFAMVGSARALGPLVRLACSKNLRLPLSPTGRGRLRFPPLPPFPGLPGYEGTIIANALRASRLRRAPSPNPGGSGAEPRKPRGGLEGPGPLHVQSFVPAMPVQMDFHQGRACPPDWKSIPTVRTPPGNPGGFHGVRRPQPRLIGWPPAGGHPIRRRNPE